MNKKTILITGASSGIGYEMALGLAKRNHEMILICRDSQKAETSKESIKRISGNSSIYTFTCDLSSQKSIRNTVKDIQISFNKIDVLINNAGCNYSTPTYSEDGIEMQFAVNHLAPFMLTCLLINTLKASADGRIINMSSRAHARGMINFKDLYFKDKYSALAAYNQSKLANVLFTYELARKLSGTAITVNCMHPGLVNTDIGNKHATPIHNLFWSIVKHLGKSPQQASLTGIYLAISDETRSITASYFANCKQIKSSALSYNSDIAKKLWYISEQLTGISFS